MKSLNTKIRQDQKGFTLVELAIVMIIVGLLIGGILKGQELITNAQVASTVTQAKAIDAAVSTFKDSYRALPGDMLRPGERLPNCTGICATEGDGTGRLNNAPDAAPTNADEGVVLFSHLAAADLIGGIDGAGDMTWGSAMPAASVGGGFYAGYFAGGAALGNNADARGGHYLALIGMPDTAATAASGAALTPSQAERIDGKMDDGSPSRGSVFSEAETECASAGASGLYETAGNAQACNIYIRIQG